MEWTMILTKLGEGMLVSIEIFAWTLLLSLPLGLLVAFGRMSGNVFLRGFVKFYISVMRGTPLMLQLMVFYYGPFLLFHVSLPGGYRFIAVLIGFLFNYAAYFAEIDRSGMESIPAGQYEAAAILGYSKAQAFRKIILPQMVRRTLPAVTNEMITLVKDTSLAQVISVSEMFLAASAIAAKEASMLPLFAAGIFYYVFNYLVALSMEWAERKLSYYR